MRVRADMVGWVDVRYMQVQLIQGQYDWLDGFPYKRPIRELIPIKLYQEHVSQKLAKVSRA